MLDNGSVIDKYIGDGMMALFGVDDGQPHAVCLARKVRILSPTAIGTADGRCGSSAIDPFRCLTGGHCGPKLCLVMSGESEQRLQQRRYGILVLLDWERPHDRDFPDLPPVRRPIGADLGPSPRQRSSGRPAARRLRA